MHSVIRSYHSYIAGPPEETRLGGEGGSLPHGRHRLHPRAAQADDRIHPRLLGGVSTNAREKSL